MRSVLVLAGLAFPIGAHAQACPDTPAITANECLSRQLKAADAEVARIYSKLASALPINEPDDPEGAKKLLAQSQRTWLAHRKASCAYRGLVEGGAPAYKSVREKQCLVRMTETRAAELREMLKLHE